MKANIYNYKNGKNKQEILILCRKIKEESKKKDSAISQLKNVVQTSLTGIDVPVLADSRNKNLDFSVLTEVLFLIKKLFDAKYQKEFEHIIDQLDKEARDETILALINFLLFVDNYSYQKIAQQCTQEPYLLPIRTVLKLKDKLPKDKINSIGCELFTLRFANNIERAGVSSFDTLVPDAIDVAKVFLKHQDLATSKGNLIFSFLRYLNIYEAKNIENGVQRILKELGFESNYLEKIINYCKTYRIIETNNKEKLDICKKAYSAIKKNPFIEATDIEISENIKTLNITIFTGAFAGFTLAHYDTIQLMQNLNRQNNNDSTQSIIVIAPITRPWDVPMEVLGKPPEFIGHITPRVQAIMMGLAFSNREEVFITTKAIPDPQEVPNSQERIIKIEKNLQELIQKRKPKVLINFTRSMGADDVNKMLSEAKNGKYPYNLLLISRRHSFVNLLENLIAIQEIGTARIIVTPGIRNTSSSVATMQYFNNNNDNYWSIPVVPIVKQHWSQKSIQSRKINKRQKRENTLDVNQIYKKLILEYTNYLKLCYGS